MSYIRKDILELPAYKVPQAYENAIKLDQNECPWDLPIELKVAISERLIKIDFNRYPLNEVIDLRKKIAKSNRVLPDQVCLSEGSNVILQALVNLTAHRGKVLILNPSFAVYRDQAKVFGCELIGVDLYENFTLPVEALLNAMRTDKPDIVFIANPNAPTGNLFERDSLFRVLKAARCLVVIDEAYYPFSNETLVDWLAEFPNLVLVRTFSKAFAMAGVRLGYAMGDAEIMDGLEKVLMPFRISSLTCAVADQVLQNTHYVKDYMTLILKERQRLFTEMKMMDHITVFASDANFFLFRVANANRTFKALAQKGVIVRNVSDEGLLKNCLRVTVGSPKENEVFLKVLAETL